MNKKAEIERGTAIVILALLLACMNGCSAPEALKVPKGKSEYVGGVHHFIPSDGFVPDAETAVRIAEAILIPIYGQNVVDEQKPLTATLEAEVWKVNGHFQENTLGGVAVVEIRKSDGGILRVSHGL